MKKKQKVQFSTAAYQVMLDKIDQRLVNIDKQYNEAMELYDGATMQECKQKKNNLLELKVKLTEELQLTNQLLGIKDEQPKRKKNKLVGLRFGKEVGGNEWDNLLDPEFIERAELYGYDNARSVNEFKETSPRKHFNPLRALMVGGLCLFTISLLTGIALNDLQAVPPEVLNKIWLLTGVSFAAGMTAPFILLFKEFKEYGTFLDNKYNENDGSK
jgi:hypothetical protein